MDMGKEEQDGDLAAAKKERASAAMWLTRASTLEVMFEE